ncbi:MAG: hypothetical protein OYH77_00295, partial [Pseudomonadota bacterium]|nr:hypothetical protein [Pseudomonadota bacterium]
MVKQPSMNFEKWHAARNDFIIVALPAANLHAMIKQVLRTFVAMCGRDGRGVGADGVIVCCEYQQRLMIWIINADGSFASNCGNGLRCAAKYFFARHVDQTQVLIGVG